MFFGYFRGMGAPSLDWLEQLEHDLAYFGTALFLTMGFRTLGDRAAPISFLVGLAAVMELIQRMIPVRHSQFIDWFASSIGAASGSHRLDRACSGARSILK